MKPPGPITTGAGGGLLGMLAASAYFLAAHQPVAVHEGGYSDHADDLGGATMHGVTEEVARREGYEGAMEALPESLAVAIAYNNYWRPLALDRIAATYEPVAAQLYDISFNAGPGRAAEIFQRCLNALNNQQRWYADVAVDRAIGPRTLAAFDAYADRRGEAGGPVLHTCIITLQGWHYIRISEARERNESFTFGWLRRITDD